MKKISMLIILLVVMLVFINTGSTAVNTLLRSAGSAGDGINITLADTDTLATGWIRVDDTTYSDTLALDTLSKYMNIFIHLYDFDTGTVLTTDSVRDTIVVRTMTCFGYGRPSYAMFTDTFVNVPDSVWHKYFLDTTAMTNFYFETIIWDSIDEVVTPDVNTYYMDMRILSGGSR